jgi:hydrophobe/amphiphile efflux-1 (HAE1) family protein
MQLTHFFIERPIFATVLSLITLLIGSIAFIQLPITQYPEIAPPTIQVNATYPGASAQIIAETVATPLEQEINGIEDMLYMFSQSSNDGQMTLTVTFNPGTDLDMAQVLVQNRVSAAEPRLPEMVRRLGVTTRKNSPDLMLVVNLYSPDGSYDQTYIANYVTLQIKDELARIPGVGEVRVFGASQYAMRIWLDPDKIAELKLTADDVLNALRNQNIQVASGTLNQSPTPDQLPFELTVQTLGRLVTPEQFEDIVVKAGAEGEIVRLADIARVELGAESYTTRGYLAGKPAIALPIFQRPGTNALDTAKQIQQTMERLGENFPPDLVYTIVYNPTEYIEQSMRAVVKTIFEAILLVSLVIVIFLQNWRVAIIPILAIPISLIGTFAVLNILGYSLNYLTLFGLILAIGIVVDDAIVVVENMERNIAEGMSPRKAAHHTMDEVGTALIAMGLVVVAVFLPTLFIGGITGKFFQQFGMTVAIATVISVIVSLTLSPALAARLFKANHHDHATQLPLYHPVRYLFAKFNTGLHTFARQYGRFIGKFLRLGALALIIYALLIALTAWQFQRVPTGFIPSQDQGYFIVSIQLPPGASLSRTDEIVQQAAKRLMEIDGVKNAVAFAGFSGATYSGAANAAAIFPVLEDFSVRKKHGWDYDSILNQMQQAMSQIEEALIFVIPPPSVRGMGRGGGFKMMIQDRTGRGFQVLDQAVWDMAQAANRAPATTRVFTLFETNTPHIYLNIDRERAEKLEVPISRVFSALEIYLGSVFVNDFNFLGRTYRVTAQADAPYRKTIDDIARIRVRDINGNMIPLGSVVVFENKAAPARVPRYNLYPAAELLGDTTSGYSSGQALTTMERLAEKLLPEGLSFEWTEIALQEKIAGNTGTIAFILGVVFVFLLLAAQYESWTLPLAIILIVPMCLLSAITGISLAGMDNNILTQIGFVTLIALASKNAILIVEFARQKQQTGLSALRAAIEAAQIRLRPILMTSFSFIFGVIPLVIASGPGAEMRQALGVTVFGGMIGVTFFGLLFTPLFFILCRQLPSWLSNHLFNREKK